MSQQWHMMPNMITYNATISACEKGPAVDPKFLRQMQQQWHMMPNVITYNATISTCEKGLVRKA